MNKTEQDLEPSTFAGTKAYFALTGEGLVKDFEAIKQFVRSYTKARIIYQKMSLEYLYISKHKPQKNESSAEEEANNGRS